MRWNLKEAGGNTLTYPENNGYINGFRTYFKLHDLPSAARAFAMSFGNEESGIESLHNLTTLPVDNSAYTLDGRKLQNRPTQKDVYIVSGKKMIIK